MNRKSEDTASGIDVDAIRKEYDQRSMETWSDRQLGFAVSDVIQRPRAGLSDSFVLHAPLETAARAALLAHVTPEVRRVARLRMISIASRYEAFGPGVAVPKELEAGDPVGRLIDAVLDRDSDTAEAAAIHIARTRDRTQMISALAEFVIPLTSAAAHTPIFLHLLQRSDPRGPVTPALLAPLSRELASGSGKAIHWIEGWAAHRPTDAATLQHRLMNTPSQPTKSTFIHPMMEAVDTSGLAKHLLGDTVGHFDRRAAASILRVAAMSMIQDTPDEAPYGWTHCLTIPQGVLEIAHATPRPDIALAVAATHVAAMRASMGQTVLSDRPLSDYPTVDLGAIIDEAASHHDAHVAKYALACIDAAAFDPEARNLYHSAAAHLLETWRGRTLPDDPLRGTETRP